MKSKKHIDQEIDKTLESLDGVQRAAASPYLFTRIKASLEREEKSIWNAALNLISRPAIAAIAFLLLIIVSASLVLASDSNVTQGGQDAEQILASEYNLSDTTVYDSTIDPE